MHVSTAQGVAAMRPLVTVEGEVRRRQVNGKSKSAHEAVVLVCAGRDYTLRRKGGPALGDSVLDALVGKRLRATGIVAAGQLIMGEYDLIERN
jgi:hypothetical protein